MSPTLDTRSLVLALVADDRGAYKLTTTQLERVMAATIGATHGRKSDDPLVYAVERLRRAISAVLQARRRLDALEAQAAPETAPAPAPTTPGGQRVPLPPAPPAPRPTGAAARLPQPVDLF